MIPTERMREFIQKLKIKSSANQVRWMQEEVKAPSHMSKMVYYRVLLPSSVFRIGLQCPNSKPDIFVAEIHTRDGLVLGRLAAPAEPGDTDAIADSELLQSVFYDAERVTTGWDSLLNTIESSFESDQIIGEIPEHEEVMS